MVHVGQMSERHGLKNGVDVVKKVGIVYLNSVDVVVG